MKKIIAIILSILTLACCVGCTAASADNELNLIEAGKLKVAVSPDYAPMEFVDTNGNFVGFDIMLAQYIADELDLELEIVPMSFQACQTAVSMGSVDMSISGFSWTSERAENYNLTNWYHAGENEDNQILITLAENEGKYTTAESLKGLKVGAQGASLQEDLCKDQLADCQLVQVTDLHTALLQLQNGDCDVLAVAEGNADAIIANNEGIIKSGFSFVVDKKFTDNLILIQKGNDALTERVNEILAKSEQHWDTWYAQSQQIAGVDVSYDDNGNPIDPDAAE